MKRLSTICARSGLEILWECMTGRIGAVLGYVVITITIIKIVVVKGPLLMSTIKELKQEINIIVKISSNGHKVLKITRIPIRVI